MKELFITSSALILILLALRAVFRTTISRRVQYALWGLVLLRLLIPVSLPALDFSILSVSQPVQETLSAGLENRTVYIPVAREPLADHQTAPDLTPDLAMPPAASSVWVVENDETAALYQRLTAGEILTLVWLAGMGAMGVFFLVTNLRFGRKLRKGRTPYTIDDCALPVYLVEEGLPSPCLFGLFRPAIYLTPAAISAPERLRHVLAHETAHARHGDPLWSLLRCVCLAIYWFNPLVWVAALVSRTDCELACDEAALSHLDQAERIAYGQTLLSLVPVRRAPSNPLLSATTMTAGKRQLRDRILRIAENRQTVAVALFAVVALVALVCVVTFTGGSGDSDDPRPLTGDELAYFNEEFFNGEYLNIRNQFLSSQYESPADMDLFELFYCGTGLPETLSEEEHRLVGSSDVPTTKLSAEAVNQVLAEYTGLTVSETTGIGLERFDYLEAYDAYYSSHGDTNYRSQVTISSGERVGDLLHLYYNDTYFADGWKCVTLKDLGQDTYHFVSNLPAEKPIIPTVYPDGAPLLVLPLTGIQPYQPETLPINRHTDDCEMRFGGVLTGDDTIVRIYRSTDGNTYAAIMYASRAGRDGMTEWDAGCFLTLPENTDGDRVDMTGFSDLFGHSGVVISYDGKISENHFNTINDYFYFDDNAPVLLARTFGTSTALDLDGDGANELVASAGDFAQIFFQREGSLYQADLKPMLEDAWSEARYVGFGSWDVSRRCLPLSGEIFFPQENNRSASAPRTLYYTGSELRLYQETPSVTDHVVSGVTAPEEVLAAAKVKVLEKLDWWRNHTGGQSFIDGAWQDVGEVATWDDWRITQCERIPNIPLLSDSHPEIHFDVYRLGYELHTTTPEKVTAAGGMYILEDGWVGGMYDEASTLVFLIAPNSGPRLVESQIPSDASSPDAPFFLAGLARSAMNAGLLTPAELRAEVLYSLFYDNQTQFLNELGAYPASEQTAALEALVAHSNDTDPRLLLDGLQTLERNSSDLTEEGRGAYARLKAAVLLVTREGMTEALPTTLFTGNGYRISIPNEGWRFGITPSADIVDWVSVYNDAVRLSVRRWPGTDTAAAVTALKKDFSAFTLEDDANGGFSGRDTSAEQYLHCRVFADGDTAYTVSWQYPMIAEEGFGALLPAVVDTFVLQSSAAAVAAQTVLEAAAADKAIALTLTTRDGVGGGRYERSPTLANGPNRILHFSSSFNWKLLTTGSVPANASTLQVASPDGNAFLQCWQGSEQVLCKLNGEQFWLLAGSLSEEDVFDTDIFSYLRLWYDEAEIASLRADIVIPNKGQSHQEIAQTWVDQVQSATLRVTSGSGFANTYVRNIVSIVDIGNGSWYEPKMLETPHFYFSYDRIFVPENQEALMRQMAGNTAEYQGEHGTAPDGAFINSQRGPMYLAEDGWRCDGTGTG